ALENPAPGDARISWHEQGQLSCSIQAHRLLQTGHPARAFAVRALLCLLSTPGYFARARDLFPHQPTQATKDEEEQDPSRAFSLMNHSVSKTGYLSRRA